MRNTKRIIALATVAAFSQVACYNSYFISKGELRKLESSVDQEETVTVYGDCPGVGEASLSDGDRPLYAQAEGSEESGAEETATDAPPAESADSAEPAAEAAEADSAASGEAPLSSETAPSGCAEVTVSTNNALKIVTQDGEELRVTPFNFIMSGGQLVSPEYDLLENLNNVEGAEVSEFSTWKTVGTVVGVSAVAIGSFVAISLLAGDSSGFSNQ